MMQYLIPIFANTLYFISYFAAVSKAQFQYLHQHIGYNENKSKNELCMRRDLSEVIKN